MLARILADGMANHPGDPALVVGDRTWAYADLFRLSQALSGALAKRGIRPGDRVAFLLPNGLDIVLSYYACFALGAIAVPLNVRFPPEMLAYVLDHSEARVLIGDARLCEGLSTDRIARPHLEAVYLTDGGAPPGTLDFGDLLRGEAAPSDDRAWDAGHPAALFYTSGTTGLPKGVIHTHGSLLAAARNQIAEIGITARDRTLIVLPICYLVAFGAQVLPFHAVGAASVVLPGFDPHGTLEAIGRHRPTKLFAFPKVYHDLAEAAPAGGCDAVALDFCFSAGEAMAVALQERFRATFGIDVTEGCGMTELHVYAMNPPRGPKKVGSIGRAISGMEVRLVDEQGQPVEQPDVIGEIVVRGGSMTAGYWKNPDLTAEKIRDGWFHTGDLASRDADGWYWFFSRKSEVIRQGGLLVSPLEVEAALYRHPAVREVGVAGRPDVAGGQSVVAHVVLRADAGPVDARTLIDFATAQLAPGKAPRRVVLTDRLPYGLTGKIDRRALANAS